MPIGDGRWAAVFLGFALLLPFLPLLVRLLRRLLGIGGRALAALGSLALLKLVEGFVGLSLGVNVLNALVLALLGVPGLGLLMLLDWTSKL